MGTFHKDFPRTTREKTKIKIYSVSLKARATLRELKERAARKRLEELTERSVQIFEDEEEQSIGNEAAAEGGT